MTDSIRADLQWCEDREVRCANCKNAINETGDEHEQADEVLGRHVRTLLDLLDECQRVLEGAGKPVETKPQVGRSVDYANGFRVGAQCQRLQGSIARAELLEKIKAVIDE